MKTEMSITIEGEKWTEEEAVKYAETLGEQLPQDFAQELGEAVTVKVALNESSKNGNLVNWDEKLKKESARLRHLYIKSKLIGTIAYGIPQDMEEPPLDLHYEFKDDGGGDIREEYLNAIVPVGVSLVHINDTGNKQRGREIAFGRLMIAKQGKRTPKGIYHKLITKGLNKAFPTKGHKNIGISTFGNVSMRVLLETFSIVRKANDE